MSTSQVNPAIRKYVKPVIPVSTTATTQTDVVTEDGTTEQISISSTSSTSTSTSTPILISTDSYLHELLSALVSSQTRLNRITRDRDQAKTALETLERSVNSAWEDLAVAKQEFDEWVRNHG